MQQMDQLTVKRKVCQICNYIFFFTFQKAELLVIDRPKAALLLEKRSNKLHFARETSQ